jgi:putative ABC transport system substrate-binding protein
MLAACLGLAGFGAPTEAEELRSPARIAVFLVAFSPTDKKPQEFRLGLRDAGHTEGRDVVVEWVSANGDYDRVPQLVAELVRRKPDVIVVENTLAARALKHNTSSIPIVMAVIADPVGTGLVASLAHPGANITGLSMMTNDLTIKRLQLLREVVPGTTRVAVVWNPRHPWHAKVLEELKAGAPSLSIDLTFVSVSAPEEIVPAFTSIKRARAQAVYALDDTLLFVHRTEFLELASKARLPVIHGMRELAQAGGLLSYGVELGHLFRRSAWYVDKILMGTKPAELPVEQPNKFELIINLKTAKTLGITIPDAVLLRADEVIR